MQLKSPVLQSEKTSFAKIILPSEWEENADPICHNGTLITFTKDQLRCQTVYFQGMLGSTTYTALGKDSVSINVLYIIIE